MKHLRFCSVIVFTSFLAAAFASDLLEDAWNDFAVSNLLKNFPSNIMGY